MRTRFSLLFLLIFTACGDFPTQELNHYGRSNSQSQKNSDSNAELQAEREREALADFLAQNNFTHHKLEQDILNALDRTQIIIDLSDPKKLKPIQLKGGMAFDIKDWLAALVQDQPKDFSVNVSDQTTAEEIVALITGLSSAIATKDFIDAIVAGNHRYSDKFEVKWIDKNRIQVTFLSGVFPKYVLTSSNGLGLTAQNKIHVMAEIIPQLRGESHPAPGPADKASKTPQPSVSPTPSVLPSPTVTPTPSPSPTLTPSFTPTVMPSASPTPMPSDPPPVEPSPSPSSPPP